ncbi:aldehyde dehydrogenase family protein [Streptomyces atroolivaceus]|uniref:aldehyde dehydrogenase family protein n=1 Tax=Streptomyces atroolivaceus TaxID=66869 RepID=UPI0036478541
MMARLVSRYINVGQSCVNAKRFIVEDAVADEFVAAFTAAAAALKVGDPTDPEPSDRWPAPTSATPCTTRSGAPSTQVPSLALGGEVPDGPGCYYPPTVLDHVRPGMAAFDEETFGPVAVTRAADADEAIALANRTEHSLGAALWTSDLARARRLTRVLDAGTVFVNGMVASDPRPPFGGIKKSGYGRELGAEGIREFVNTKTVWIGPAL